MNRLIQTNGPNPNVLVTHLAGLLKESELKAIDIKVSKLHFIILLSKWKL